jgi:HSP20 family protein
MAKHAIVRRQSEQIREMDDLLDDFRRQFGASFMYSPFSAWSRRFPPLMLEAMRTPLCDMLDRSDKYELHVEVPGIDKEKIDVKATKNAVEISANQSEKKSQEKRGNYVYNERSQRSFYRRIETPDEIVPSKISAKMVNGILNIELPKREPAKSKHTKVEIK